jgi:hypothetical protein
MAKYITDLDASTPSRSDPVADGADEIKEIKSSLKATFPYANSSLGVSNYAVETAILETIPAMLERLSQLDGQSPVPPSDKFRGVVASCKYNTLEPDPDDPDVPPGSPLPYTYNVLKVEVPAPLDTAPGGLFGSCRVTFEKPVPDFDRHYTCLIQPYATTDQHVIATVTDQQDDFVEWTWLVYDGPSNTWKVPTAKIGFSFMAVDYEV